MSKATASEVILSAQGLVVIGARGPGTRVWYRPTGTTRLHEHTLKFEPPRESPAALMPGGRLLVVGRNGEAILIEAGRTPQPVPALGNGVVEGLSPDLVAFCRGPHFYRLVEGKWRDESPEQGEAQRGVGAVGGYAVGAEGDCWVPDPKGWKRTKLKTTATLTCAQGEWAGGPGVVVQRLAKSFKLHPVKGTVTAVCPWGKSALVLVDGTLRELSGAPVKAPPRITSVSAHGDALAVISNGSLLERTGPRERWERRSLPKLARK